MIAYPNTKKHIALPSEGMAVLGLFSAFEQQAPIFIKDCICEYLF